jgi:predicted transposase YdaD
MIETILVYKFPNNSREELQKMPGYNDISLKQTRFYKDVYTEGQQEGKLEGKLEGEVMLLERLIVKRFGPVTEDTRTRLRTATTDQLKIWSERILDASKLAEVFSDH